MECKPSTTYQSRYFDVLNKIAQDELSLDVRQQAVVYGGEAEAHTPRGDMVPTPASGRSSDLTADSIAWQSARREEQWRQQNLRA